MNLGLLGWPVSHSLSPMIHNSALNVLSIEGKYVLFPFEPVYEEKIQQLLSNFISGDLSGLNVTIPFKQVVMKYMDVLTPTAEIIGAVNTIYYKNNKLIGDNTDGPGFISDLSKKYCPNGMNKIVFVLGNGGSARAIVWALLEMKWEQIILISRNLEKSQLLANYFNTLNNCSTVKSIKLDSESLLSINMDADLVVNTTPVGMYPKIEFSPWPTGVTFPNSAFYYDLIYNPVETLFLKEANSEGLKTSNGLGMLIEQAALAFEIWTGVNAPREIMLSAVNTIF